MTTPDGTLYAALSHVPDHRNARGRSYPLASLLTFAATAMLCGARSLYAIAGGAATATTSPRSWGSPGGGGATATAPPATASCAPSSPAST